MPGQLSRLDDTLIISGIFACLNSQYGLLLLLRSPWIHGHLNKGKVYVTMVGCTRFPNRFRHFYIRENKVNCAALDVGREIYYFKVKSLASTKSRQSIKDS